jgi:hypothetical protein
MAQELDVTHMWQPLIPLVDPAGLALPEMRALESLWKAQRARLEALGHWRPFWDRIVRWWSIETGVLERVFDLSLGVTQILVQQGFAASLIPHGETDKPADQVINILNDHQGSIDMVMDVVGGQRELTVGWIKEVHALLCAHQETARAITPTGQMVDVPLPKGLWKTRPNTPTRADGSVHEYCPPEHVASEMERLIQIYRAIPVELPEVRSAWLHHAFTAIHPFEDGNGRVARALASVDFLRARLFPVLVRREDKFHTYLPALEQADKGDLRPLVKLFAERQQDMVLKAISIADEVVGNASALSVVLAAAKDKVAQRADQGAVERAGMRSRLGGLADRCRERFERAREEIQATRIPGCAVRVTRSDGTSAHYFRRQIIETARKGEYWADMHEPWEWARLQVSNGGFTDVVVAFHFVGNPSPGACVAAMFMEHRSREDDQSDRELLTLDQEALFLFPNEAEDAQVKRLNGWLEIALRKALAVWVRYL